MLNTYKATIDQQGQLQLPHNLKLPCGSKVLITVLDEPSSPIANDEALLSESALSEDWNKPEEDEAWEFLQKEQ